MKKIRKQLTAALLLTMCIIGGFQAPVLAYYYNEGDIGTIQPCYVGVNSSSCSLSISSGTATCKGTVNLKSNYTASLTLKLQRSTDGNSWTTLKTWSATGTSISKSSGVSSGYKYRATLNVKVYNSSGTQVDNFTVKSATKSY